MSSHWKPLAPSPPPNATTFAAQAKLPRLPVPPLEKTLERLKPTLKALAKTQEEYEEAVRKVNELGLEGGIGRVLQERLERRRDETEHWLEEWWDAGGYFGYRDSVVVNVSYFYGFGDHPAHLPQTAVHRAAALTRAALLFRRGLRQGNHQPDATKEGPICMDTYRWMFDCCRVPSAPLDHCVTYAKPSDDGNAGHIIVLRRGNVWKVPIAKDGVLISTADLEKQFQYIYDNTKEDAPGIGFLAANNRDVWTKDYTELSSNAHNASILTDIHSSAFLVCLDTFKPSNPVEFSRALWHGQSGPMTNSHRASNSAGALANRFVDKPVQFIVFDDGKAGIMGEHSVMDGTPTVRLCDDVLDAIASPSFDSGEPVAGDLAPPQKKEWRVDAEIERAIGEARKAAEKLTSDQELGYFLTKYGKKQIKAFGVSPDSWAQMIVQLAYHRLISSSSQSSGNNAQLSIRNGGTYEAASTRKFYKGRTETIRIVSEESERFVKAMDDPAVSGSEKKALFEKAAKRHITLAREAGNAEGVDRVLLGLRKCLKEGEELPALYDDPLFKRSSYWVLSTSAIFSKHFVVYGWGEVVPDGFGVAYMTGFDDYLFFTITSRVEMPNAEFCKEIQKASDDLYNLFTSTASPREGKSKL